MRTADKIIYGGAVFTAQMKDERPFAGGVAVQGDTILAVGSREEIAALKDSHTEVFDCGPDSLIMPGINDGHMHLKETIAATNGVPLRYVGSQEQCIANAVAWEREHPQYQWVMGYGWHFTHWQDKRPPDNKLLNQAFPDKPVCLVDTDFHAVWLNDAALRELGVSKDGPDPRGSVINRFPDGTPTGYAQEVIALEAMEKATAAMETDAQTMARNFASLMHECNSYGLTGIADMMVTEPKWRDVYGQMAAEGKITCRVSLAQNFWPDNFAFEAESLAGRFPDIAGDVWFYAVKGFFDGVGMGHTSWQIHPFSDRRDSCGGPLLPEGELREKFRQAITAGHHVHIHACGDMSVRKALDWWEEARKDGCGNSDYEKPGHEIHGYEKPGHQKPGHQKPGHQKPGHQKPGQRLTIAHNDTVDPADIQRFAQLGVVAAMQPDMLAPCLKWQDNIYPAIFGPELSRTAWACRSLLDAGTVVAFSTDSPVGLFDPMLNIYRAVTRQHADGEPAGGWIPEQKISLSNALWAYTYGSAYQFGKENFLGTLVPGKKADIAVLDKNLFAVHPEMYLGTKSKLTLLNGRVVYSRM